jgi:hypothetical protein
MSATRPFVSSLMISILPHCGQRVRRPACSGSAFMGRPHSQVK